MPDKRHMHHAFKTGKGPGVIAHAPETAMATHPALVATEDNQRVVSQTVLSERCHHRAHAVVHTAQLGGITADGDKVVLVILVVEEPFVRLCAREGRKLLVRVKRHMPVAAWLEQGAAQPVGAVVAEKQEERLPAVLPDKLHRALRPQVGEVLWLLALFAIFNNLRIVKR